VKTLVIVPVPSRLVLAVLIVATSLRGVAAKFAVLDIK
jgi:hypothetical protein